MNYRKPILEDIPINLKSHIRTYREYLRFEKGNSPCTISHKIRSLKRFFRESELQDLSSINDQMMHDFFYETAKRNDWSAATWNNNWTYLKCFCNWIIIRKLAKLKSNPVESLHRPKRPKLVPRRLSKEDLCKIFSACSTYPWTYDLERLRNIAIIATMAYCGVRINELLNIRTFHVSLNSQVLFVEKGKGQKSRSIPIPNNLKRIMKDYEVFANRERPNRDFYFCSVLLGKQMTHKTIYRMKKKIVEATGVPFTPHQLRHTFASISVENHIPLPFISRAMGHTSILHTESYLAPEKGMLHDLYRNFCPFQK